MSKITKAIYALLLIFLVLQPHVIADHIFSLPPAYAQSVSIVILMAVAYAVYRIHHWDITRRERQKAGLRSDLQRVSGSLNEAFKYLGEVNRQLPLFMYITSDLLSKFSAANQNKKEFFDDLLAVAAVSAAKTPWALLRFIQAETGRTLAEFSYPPDAAAPRQKISNKKLLDLKISPEKNMVNLDDRRVFQSSDRRAAIQCFLILPKTEGKPEPERSDILQIITDQGQLFYQYLLHQKA